MIYLQLFLAFLQIGAFSFGGGYAAMPLIQAQVIDHYGWITAADFTNLVTIAEMTPGPIAINAATFVGNQTAGIAGALSATAGVLLPSCLFVTFLAWLYQKYRSLSALQEVLKTLRPAVVAMILAAGVHILLPLLFANGKVSLASGNFSVDSFILFLLAFFLLRKFHLNPIHVMLGTGVLELLLVLIF